MALSFKENVVVGFSDFWSRKLRSFITIFGIILGTMSIIVVLSLVNGMNKETLKWMVERGGFTKITIWKNWRYDNKKNLKDYLTLDELNLIIRKVKEIKYFSPQKRTYAMFHYKKEEDFFSLEGVMPDYKYIEEWDVSKGRFLSDYDIKNNNSVIVIGNEIKKTLFGNREAIGKYISVNKVKFRIIGIMQEKYLKSTRMGSANYNALAYMNKKAFIPLTTFLSKIDKDEEFTRVELKVKDIQSAEIATKKLRVILKGLRGGEEVFTVRSMEENKKDFEKSSATFRIIFYVISVISLLVGGIVIMNILLSTIKERTREIGVRIAVGAKRVDIFMQFLIQTVLITFIGGIIGIGLALVSLKKIGEYLQLTFVPNAQTIIAGLVVSVGVGLIFGVLPSIKASKLNPVEALRYE